MQWSVPMPEGSGTVAATFSKMEMQHSPKTFCNFLEKQLAKNSLERVIAGKYGLLPATVRRWRDHYREYGDKAFWRGYTKKDTRSPREIELEKENEELREEVQILKKAAAFLANVKHE